MKKINDDKILNSKILIVEDSIINAKIIDTYLAEYGFETMYAESGELTLSMLETTTPDLILLDIQLPGIDGFEVCTELQKSERLAKIPVIYITAMTNTEDKLKGFAAGGVDYITKPIHEQELIARVITHLKISKYQDILEQEVDDRTKYLQLQMEALNNEIQEKMVLTREKQYLINHLNSIIDSTPSLIICLDRELIITQWNSKATEILGVKSEDAIGKNIEVFYKGPFLDQLRESLKTERVITFNQENGENTVIYPIKSDRIPGIVLRIDYLNS